MPKIAKLHQYLLKQFRETIGFFFSGHGVQKHRQLNDTHRQVQISKKPSLISTIWDIITHKDI